MAMAMSWCSGGRLRRMSSKASFSMSAASSCLPRLPYDAARLFMVLALCWCSGGSSCSASFHIDARVLGGQVALRELQNLFLLGCGLLEPAQRSVRLCQAAHGRGYGRVVGGQDTPPKLQHVLVHGHRLLVPAQRMPRRGQVTHGRGNVRVLRGRMRFLSCRNSSCMAIASSCLPSLQNESATLPMAFGMYECSGGRMRCMNCRTSLCMAAASLCLPSALYEPARSLMAKAMSRSTGGRMRLLSCRTASCMAVASSCLPSAWYDEARLARSCRRALPRQDRWYSAAFASSCSAFSKSWAATAGPRAVPPRNQTSSITAGTAPPRELYSIGEESPADKATAHAYEDVAGLLVRYGLAKEAGEGWAPPARPVRAAPPPRRIRGGAARYSPGPPAAPPCRHRWGRPRGHKSTAAVRHVVVLPRRQGRQGC
mmetsp:Transcript_14212/g.55954  ORF Transcript_14212/g.55954 Transcript_14212/m.55954 type:complete len:427 (+) Transcript_14212:632-1912(+)